MLGANEDENKKKVAHRDPRQPAAQGKVVVITAELPDGDVDEGDRDNDPDTEPDGGDRHPEAEAGSPDALNFGPFGRLIG